MKLSHIGYLAAVFILAGCASVKRLPPPDDYSLLGEIPGIPCARFWGDDAPTNNVERSATLRQQIMADPAYEKHAPIYFLALSGGGQKGAFGAGLLAGWTASGSRPEFRMVTGISTGSLIAPFAFLGPEYDEAIHEMYSRFSTKDVLKTRFLSGLFGGDSVADNSPLREIIKRYLTPKEIERIAAEHRRGRRLFVGTTNLDVQRPVIWDIGHIAASGNPKAYDLILDILLASAAIPGAFPPMYFNAESNGRLFDELHVDGGVTTQVFISPIDFNMEAALKNAGLDGPVSVYMIRNTGIAPETEQIPPKTVPILTKSLSTLLRAQGLGDMYRIYLDAERNGLEYHAAYIPSDFRAEPDELFDIAYMTELYDLAFGQAKNGFPWKTKPPEFKHTSPRGPQ